MQQLVQELVGSKAEGDRRIVIVAWALDGLYAKLLYILAHLDYPELCERICGMVFFSTPHDADSLASYVNVIEVLANPSPPRADLRSSAPYLLGLNKTFASLARQKGLKCLSFGSHPYAQHKSLRKLSFDVRLGFGTHYDSTSKDLYTISRFSTRDALEYLQLVDFLRSVITSSPTLDTQDPMGGQDAAEYLCIVRRPLMKVLVRVGERREEKEGTEEEERMRFYDNLGEPLDSDIWREITTISYKSLFAGSQEALKCISSQVGGVKTLIDRVKSKELVVDISASPRECELVHAFMALTLGLRKDKGTDETIGLQRTPLPSDTVRVPYDLVYDPPQVRIVKDLILQLRTIVSSAPTSGDSDVESMIERMESFSREKIRIAIVGRPNAGKSTFLNALLKRDILPHSEKTCTGSQLQIIGCDSKEEEQVEIEYMSRREYEDLIAELKGKLENIEQQIEVYQEPEFRYQYAEQAKSLQAQLDRENSFLSELINTYESVGNSESEREIGSPVVKVSRPSKEETLEQILSKTAINVSRASCTLINSVRLKLNSNILQYVTLVDTPGRGEDSLRDRRVIEAVQHADGWIYLTNFDSHDQHIAEDVNIFQAEARNAHGLIVITKFDVHVPDNHTDLPGSPDLDTYVRDKRLEVQKVAFDSSLPAISCRLLLDATSSVRVRLRKGAKHTAEQLELLRKEEQIATALHNRIKALSRLHVGQFLYESIESDISEDQTATVSAGDGLDDDDDDDDEDYDDEDEEDHASLADLIASAGGGTNSAHIPQSLADYGPLSIVRKRKFLQDAAMESSMLLPMLDDVYDMANRHIVVRDFGLLLSSLKDYLYTHMERVDALLNSTNFDLELVNGRAQFDRQLLMQRQSAKNMADTLDACKEALEDMAKACNEREERMEEEIVQLASGITATKLSVIRDGFMEEHGNSIIAARLSRHTFTVRLHDTVTPAISDMANSSVRDVLSNAAIESLLHPVFRPIKQHVLVSVECATAKLHAMHANHESSTHLDGMLDLVSYQQKKRGLKAFKKALQSFIDSAKDAGVSNARVIARNMRVQLASVHGTILSLVQRFMLQQEKKLHILLKTIQQRELQTLPRPVDLLLITKELLLRERHQVSELHSYVLRLLLDNQMKEQRSRKGLLKSKSKLSKAEEAYLALTLEIYTKGACGPSAQTHVAMISPDIPLTAVQQAINEMSGRSFSKLSLKDFSASPPPSLIVVEKRRIVALINGRMNNRGVRTWEELGVTPSSAMNQTRVEESVEGVVDSPLQTGSASVVTRFTRTHEELLQYFERNLCRLLSEHKA